MGLQYGAAICPLLLIQKGVGVAGPGALQPVRHCACVGSAARGEGAGEEGRGWLDRCRLRPPSPLLKRPVIHLFQTIVHT